MKNILFIGMGGAIGTMFRFGLNHLEYYSTFPFWTMFENVLGSLLLGVLTGYVITRKVPEHWRNGLGPGLCGSFTTMSTFAYDAVFVANQISLYASFFYISGSLLFGILAAFLGLNLGQRFAGIQAKEVDPV